MKKTFLVLGFLLSHVTHGTEFGNYVPMQWGLSNSGASIEIKLTDIDRLDLQAKSGEDINLGTSKEVDGKKIRVAVIDSGLDLTHPEFRNKIYRNESECRAWEQYTACLATPEISDEGTKACHEKWAKTDTDQNGYPMDCHGWNVAAPVNEHSGVQGNNDVSDIVGHGTHISGVIAAAIDGQGIDGVLRNVEILPVKVSGSTEEVKEDNTTDIFAKGILYALRQGVDIINLSVGWSSNEDSLLVSELIKKAHELGVLVVVAGGNSAHSTETYPCAYNEVICVGSHNPDGSRSHFSNHGSSIDIYAPGHNILSTWPLELRPKLFTERHGFEFKNGTSFSSPYVVGVLARLLNLGFSPDEARAKLLTGTRNGNLDFTRARSAEVKSFIYPYKKSAAFMNWHEGERKFILRLKNYVRDSGPVTLKLSSKALDVKIKDPVKTFAAWSKDEIKEVSFLLDGNGSVPSELSFDLQIVSRDESKTYPVQVVATTVVHDKFSRADTQRLPVQTTRDLEGFALSPFQNVSPSPDTDFLLTQVVDGQLAVGILKLIDGTYRLGRLHTTIFNEAIIIQAAKVDIDLDGKAEYVIAGMYENKDKKWTARFYVFDENFRPSPVEICPGNEHVNLLTSMGTDLRWMKKNNRLVPTWMASGYAPTIDQPAFNPWVPRVANDFKTRIYYLDEKGLRTFSPASVDWAEFSPMKFFTQSKDELERGELKFLYTLDKTFIKTYAIGSTVEQALGGDLQLDRYQNLYPLDGRVHPSTLEMLFSENDATTGRGRLSAVDPLSLEASQQEFSYSDPLDPVQLILSKTPAENFFAHTKYNLLYLEGDKVHRTESRNAAHQIQYKRLKTKEGLYLSSQHTPGLSSELVVFEQGQLLRPAKYRFLLGNGCQEIGYHFSAWEERDQVLFYCDNSKSVFKIQL